MHFLVVRATEADYYPKLMFGHDPLVTGVMQLSIS